MIKPYPHQQRAVNKVVRAWQSPFFWKHATLGVAPTGSGKSIIGLSAFEQYMKAEGRPMRALFIAHTLEIVKTLYKDALKYPFKNVGMLHGSSVNFWSQVTIATVQSMNDDNRIKLMCGYFGGVDVLVIDEAHRGVTATHLAVVRKLRKYNPNLKILGMTATYERTDLRGLRELFTHSSFKIQPKELIRKELLAKPRVVRPLLHDDEVGYVLSRWQRATKCKRRTIIFARDVNHAWEFCDLLRSLGQDAAVITADTPEDERADIMANTHVIVNVDVLKEGANVPNVSCIVIARQSHETPWRQMVGRGLRKDSKDCLILSANAYKAIVKIPFFVLGVPKPQTLMGHFPSGKTLFHRLMSYAHG